MKSTKEANDTLMSSNSSPSSPLTPNFAESPFKLPNNKLNIKSKTLSWTLNNFSAKNEPSKSKNLNLKTLISKLLRISIKHKPINQLPPSTVMPPASKGPLIWANHYREISIKISTILQSTNLLTIFPVVIFQKAKKASPSILIKFLAEIISLATQIMIQQRKKSTHISTKKN